jgi:hypothetical protein
VRGLSLWGAVWQAAPWLRPSDAPAVERYVMLTLERRSMAETIDADGYTLTEPIVSPRGDVVGVRHVAHPLLSPMASVDRLLSELGSKLALDARTRALVGQWATSTEKTNIEAKRLLEGRYRRDR